MLAGMVADLDGGHTQPLAGNRRHRRGGGKTPGLNTRHRPGARRRKRHHRKIAIRRIRVRRPLTGACAGVWTTSRKSSTPPGPCSRKRPPPKKRQTTGNLQRSRHGRNGPCLVRPRGRPDARPRRRQHPRSRRHWPTSSAKSQPCQPLPGAIGAAARKAIAPRKKFAITTARRIPHCQSSKKP